MEIKKKYKMKLRDKFIELLNKLPHIRFLHKELMHFKKNAYFPPGHYYSVIIDVEAIKKREKEIWKNENVDAIEGIDLHSENQLKLVKEFETYYSELPFKEQKTANLRYYLDNLFYPHTDGIIFYSIIRHFKPKQIIEIGSGYSSALILDTNNLFFDNAIKLTFIDPYPERLYSLISDNDKKATTIIESDVQLISLEVFEKLNAGDILFVDSTHVAKTGSDVNYILFEILPRLKSGVLIHFHDIFFPFEYPRDWVFKGKNWNEDYFLKAFLMYNHNFEIKFFSNYLHMLHKDAFKNMPLCYNGYNNYGGSLWIEKK
jgi:predicted O-methyltransferase YrrM